MKLIPNSKSENPLYSPLEIFHAGFSHPILNGAHGLHQLFLDRVGAGDIKRCQEVVGHSNQSILGPSAEPIDGAARDETGKLQSPVAELLSHLWFEDL